MTSLGLAESFKTMNRPDRDALSRLITQKVGKKFSFRIRRKERGILKQSLFKSSICAIKIWDRHI